MKKGFLMICVLAAVAAGCSNSGNKQQEFADKVASYVKGNQVDSLKMVYPEADFDSIAFAQEFETIEITPVEGSENVSAQFGEVASIEFKENEDGTMTIVKSEGIAVFPEDKASIARQTGMLKAGMTDVEKAKLLKDEEYFNWLAKKSSADLNNIITVKGSKVKYGTCYGEDYMALSMPVTLTNTTNADISGSDYSIGYTMVYANCSDGSVPDSYVAKKEKGVDLKAGESKTVTLKNKGANMKNPKIKWNIPQEELSKFASYNGNEYSEYKSSK